MTCFLFSAFRVSEYLDGIRDHSLSCAVFSVVEGERSEKTGLF